MKLKMKLWNVYRLRVNIWSFRVSWNEDRCNDSFNNVNSTELSFPRPGRRRFRKDVVSYKNNHIVSPCKILCHVQDKFHFIPSIINTLNL